MTRRDEETPIQIAIVDFLRLALPEAIVAHVPNGGKRGKAEAGRFKRMGVVAGFADIIVLLYGQAYLIECKTDDGELSTSQKRFRADCIAAGVPYGVARSIDEAAELVRWWGVSAIRARVSA